MELNGLIFAFEIKINIASGARSQTDHLQTSNSNGYKKYIYISLMKK